MQTIYATTTHVIRHQGNMVDLGEFRRKQALARAGSLAPRLEPEEPPIQDAAPALTLLPAAPRRRRSRRARAPDTAGITEAVRAAMRAVGRL